MLKDMKIVDIEVDGIDYRDAPDFCDAYISSAFYEDGTELSADELDELNSDSAFVYDAVWNYIH